MEKVEVVTLNELAAELKKENIRVLTDSNVFRLYPQLFTKWTYVFDAGEKSKTLETAQKILLQMLDDNVPRSGVLYTVGGGVAGDMGGFCASVFKRGIKWINVPTTLLAQADSGVGGKTAVDVGGYKNMVGSFYPPERVLVCHDFLNTLPGRELLCGLGEAVKTAYLDKNVYEIYRQYVGGAAGLFQLSDACREAKLRVVAADPHEKGLRKVLNLGHTLGHALETAGDFALSHGEYVLQGLMLESFLTGSPLHGELFEAAKKYVAPPRDFDEASICAIAKTDKKNEGKISVMHAVAVGEIEERLLTAQQLIEGLRAWKKL